MVNSRAVQKTIRAMRGTTPLASSSAQTRAKYLCVTTMASSSTTSRQMNFMVTISTVLRRDRRACLWLHTTARGKTVTSTHSSAGRMNCLMLYYRHDSGMKEISTTQRTQITSLLSVQTATTRINSLSSPLKTSF